MDKIQKVKQDSINEFGTEVTQRKYEKIALEGLWASEDLLIKKYFQKKSCILDIGCGSGRTSIPLVNLGYEVTGVDITPQMIDTAKEIAKNQNLDIDYEVGDATKLRFDSDTFDGAIFANNGWVQIPAKANRQKALVEIYRILKPGGIFILTAHRRYYALNNLLPWVIRWIKYYILKSIGIKIDEIEFGDLFFNRHVGEERLKQRQFIHMTGVGEVEEQITKAGFKLILAKSMGEVARQDAETMKASLSKNFNSYKSPFFYVCEKE